MAKIGLQLKRAREGLGLSLSDMQRLTKIHLEYLRALEEDQFDTLPSPFYVRTFLRTYAMSVGLDPKPLLDRYEWLVAGGVPSTPQPRHLSNSSLRRPMRSEPRRGHTTPPGRTYSQQMPSSPNLSAKQEGVRAPMLNPLEGQDQHQGRSLRVDEPRSLFPSKSEYAHPLSRQHYMPQTSAKPILPREEEQPSVPSSPVSPERKTKSLSTTMPETKSSTGRLPATRLPDTSSLDKPLAPRRTLEASRSSRKAGSKWMIGTAAVGALLLVSAASFYFFNSRAEGDKPSDSPAASVSADETSSTSGVGSSIAVAEKNEKPKLVLLKSGSDLEGDLYELAGSDQIEVLIKAKKGSCSLRYSEKTGGDGENFTLKAGDQKKITANGDFIWFRLGTPSNVEILVNGESIDTLAQDVAKSYRIQLKK